MGNLEICEQRLAVPFVHWTNLKVVAKVGTLARRFASSSSIVNTQHLAMCDSLTPYELAECPCQGVYQQGKFLPLIDSLTPPI
jgi:hypothetical protein